MERKEPTDPEEKPSTSEKEPMDSDEKPTNSAKESTDPDEKRARSDSSRKKRKKSGGKQKDPEKKPTDFDQKSSNSESEAVDPDEKRKSSESSRKKRKRSSRKHTHFEREPTDFDQKSSNSETEVVDEKRSSSESSRKKRKKSDGQHTHFEREPTDSDQKPTDLEKKEKSGNEPTLDSDLKWLISDKELADSGRKAVSFEKKSNEAPKVSNVKSSKTSVNSGKKRKPLTISSPWTQEKIDLDKEPHMLYHIATVSNTLNRVLDTASSIVAKKNYFTGRHSTYVPDFFFIFFFISLFLGSAILDRIFILMVFFNGRFQILGFLYFIFAMSPAIYFFLFEDSKETYLEQYNLHKFINVAFKISIVLFGVDSVFIGRKMYKNTCQEILFSKRSGEKHDGNDFYFFHIPDAKHCDIKIYCFMCTVTKSIPQLFLAGFYLLIWNWRGVIVFFAFKVIMMNMIIFSLTMAITFPIRKSPKVFRTCTSALLNCFTKFLATMCSCGLTMAVLASLFAFIGFKVVFLHLLWFIVALFPSFYMLKTLPHIFPNKLYLVTYAFIFSLVFTFIYIHPFERRGKFFYYYFHFIGILSEIAALYLLTETDKEVIMLYVSLKALVIGLMGCCLLNNVLHKVDRHKPKKKNFFEPLIL